MLLIYLGVCYFYRFDISLEMVIFLNLVTIQMKPHHRIDSKHYPSTIDDGICLPRRSIDVPESTLGRARKGEGRQCPVLRGVTRI